MIQSRFSANTTNRAFEFQRDADTPINISTLFVSHVLINFASAPTPQGKIEIFIEDDEGKDLIWDGQARNKEHLTYEPNLPIPISKDKKLVIEYPNPNTAETSVRVLWAGIGEKPL